jgi:DNA-binding transcriptional regulator YhcF (GntR family)
MDDFQLKSSADQLADHLKQQIALGNFQNHMPGAPSMASALGVDHRLVISAFEILEQEGLLLSEGVGKRRRIVFSDKQKTPLMRFQIFIYEECDRQLFYLVDLQHKLMNAGHICAFSSVTLKGLGMDLVKLKRYVEKNDVDAWITFASSKQALDWFATQKTPAYALAGRMGKTNIPGCRPNKVPALRVGVRRLIELGHRRIVMLVREERRKPAPGLSERAFIQELEFHGIKTGSYNLPDWEDNVHDFHRCLNSLFKHTPPTALILDEMQHFSAAQLHLAQMGINAPRDISIMCMDPNPAFNWCKPSVAHIDWDAAPMVRKVMQWADRVALGQYENKQDFTPAKFIEGETIGPVKKS